MNRTAAAKLCAEALEARKNAYAPYSRFAVGAALLCADGTVYTGCNIENASYGVSNCAERTAFYKAVSDGAREFRAIAIAGGPSDHDPENGDGLEPCPPCGICRQVMREFCSDDFCVILAGSADTYTEHRLAELLPMSFGPKSLHGREDLKG